MLINYSLSKAGGARRRRRAGKRDNYDRVHGDRLSAQPLLERKLQGQFLDPGQSATATNTKLQRDVLTNGKSVETSVNTVTRKGDVVSDASLGDIILRSTSMKVSVSGDVIFSPATQTTFRSASTAAKANLERRMPGATVKVSDVTGDGLINCSIVNEFYVDNQLVTVEAKCIASASDLAVHTAVVTAGANVYDIDPVDRARTPEDTLKFMRHLAINCAARG